MPSVRLQRAVAIFWKEFLDLRKNRGLFWSMLALPSVLVMVPVGVVYTYVRNPTDPSLRTMALYFDPNLPLGASAAKFLVDKTLTDWFGLFLVMPLFVPILISSHSVAAEKERRTLEPLLASPASAAEILAGKTAAALLPALVISWSAFAVMCIAVDAVAWPSLHTPLLPNGMWLFGMGVIAPLFAFFGNLVAVMLSARLGETRLAQQFSGLVTVPLLGLVGGQAAGLLRAGTVYYAIEGAVILALDLVLLRLSVRLFDRERLMTRWA
jgi:ABC-2 type transport system permease protein